MTLIPSRVLATVSFAGALAVAALALTPALALAESAVALQTSTGNTLLVSSSVLKSLPAATNDGWLAYDFSADQVTLVDAAGQRVIKGSFNDYCHAIRTLLTGGAPIPLGPRPSVTITPLGDGEKVAGQRTAKYQVSVNGQLYQEVWLAIGTPPFLARASWASVKLATCSSLGGIELAPEMDERYRAMVEHGLIVETVSKAGGHSEIRDQIVSIKDATLTPADLTPPTAWPVVTFEQFVKGH